uniref:Retrovirus-related Pol polyprotein from transposon TNT 1-94 n=1 Tax=Tanacetum cinerariifolium TaxID=118510 RepID=A0A6L2P7L2_TANCI|nr:retrovirus-related Pol polyprotein from transposon TNT 1-94 [Tanacetum cinerariifolium]
MHNNIMAAGSRDHPLMLATGRYPQWRSRFLRYIDTRTNGDALRKCILNVLEHTTIETSVDMSSKNKAHFESEKESIHLILNGIGDEIYLTVDACQIAQEILARNANPLLLVATAQVNQDPYYQTSKSHKSYAPSSKPSILTRSHTTTRSKGKEIAKLITPPSESASEEDIDPEQAQRDKDMEKVGSPVVQQSGIQCFNCKEFGHFAKEYRKPKRVKDSAYHKEKMLLCKQAKKGVPLQAEQYDWLADTNKEIDEQELEAHYSYMAKIQEVPTPDSGTNSKPLERKEMHANLKYVESLEKEIDELESDKAEFSNMYDMILPQHRSNQTKDKVVPNNSQVKLKKTQVEDPRIPSISNKIKFVTACNDSLDSRTSNVNVVYATCGKCLVDSDHFACVNKLLNDVNARTKKPNVVPTSTRKPKGHANKSVATPYKKKVASKSTTQKQRVTIGCCMRNLIVQLILFIVDSRCTKHMMDNLKLLCNFVEQYLGTVRFDNDQSYPYTISLQESTSSTPLCLMAKASPTQAWLWHRRLSHLNFDYINLLSKKDFVIGLPKLKYVKDQLCSSCEVNKAKRSSFKSKAVPSTKGRLNLLHMDLCGLMRVASINGKKYIMVIVDDYSRYTWTLFLCSKDETPKVLKEFLTMIQRNLQALVIIVRTDRGTEFLNKTLHAFSKEDGIEHQTSTARTPE